VLKAKGVLRSVWWTDEDQTDRERASGRRSLELSFVEKKYAMSARSNAVSYQMSDHQHQGPQQQTS
jgi:hypothetical protein